MGVAYVLEASLKKLAPMIHTPSIHTYVLAVNRGYFVGERAKRARQY